MSSLFKGVIYLSNEILKWGIYFYYDFFANSFAIVSYFFILAGLFYVSLFLALSNWPVITGYTLTGSTVKFYWMEIFFWIGLDGGVAILISCLDALCYNFDFSINDLYF